jgi:hypothetical protein
MRNLSSEHSPRTRSFIPSLLLMRIFSFREISQCMVLSSFRAFSYIMRLLDKNTRLEYTNYTWQCQAASKGKCHEKINWKLYTGLGGTSYKYEFFAYFKKKLFLRIRRIP